MILEIINGRINGYETAKEFAKRWGVTEEVVRVWVYRGKINALRVGNCSWIPIGTSKPEELKRGRKKKA